MEIKYCKCGCGVKLQKNNRSGYQKCHRPCEICGTPVKRSDTECCSKSCSAKLHWIRHPEMKENRAWNNDRMEVRNNNPNWKTQCSIAAKKSYKEGRVVWNKGKIINPKLTPEERMDKRSLAGYREWIKNVLIKDNYTCQITGQRGGKLSAHHLYSWDKHPEKRFDINNGVTILKSLHKEFHDIYGRGNNTPEQFEDYKRQKVLAIPKTLCYCQLK